MKFQKEWWKSGIKAWPYALLDLISFVFIIQAIKIDYIQLGYSQLAYSLVMLYGRLFQLHLINYFLKRLLRI